MNVESLIVAFAMFALVMVGFCCGAWWIHKIEREIQDQLAYHGVRIKETWADLCKIRRDPNRQLHELHPPASVSKRVQAELDNIPLHPLRDSTRCPYYVCPFDLGDLSRDNWVGGWGLGLGVGG